MAGSAPLKSLTLTAFRGSAATFKREVAIQWCGWASNHARAYGGKPWRYALIPHDAIAENMTLEFLLKQFG
jgi:hypothetical protein